jgi:hypothetical protein
MGVPGSNGDRLLPGGIDGLPATSPLVSAGLGINGALSMRHLCLRPLLRTALSLLSRSLPPRARVKSCGTRDPSPAVSASRLVVVKMRSCDRHQRFPVVAELAERGFRATVIRLAVVLIPLLATLPFWASSRNHTSSTAPAKAAHRASPGEGLDKAQSAIMFSITPLTSLPAITSPVDPDPVATFRQLIALPSKPTGKAHIDPRKMRILFDRGVATYASARTDGDRTTAAHLISAAALVGFSPARDLVARNYPQSEAVRAVVPASDAIRYALTPIMDVTMTSDESKQIFIALEEHFALRRQLDLFATQILHSMRGDSRPQLGHRIDTLLDLLARVPATCGALARLISTADQVVDRECSFAAQLQKYIETTTPAPEEEEESKRRGLLLLSQLGEG